MNIKSLPKIGMRTIKTAISIFLCLILLPGEPFFACLTAVFCIQDTIENSIKMALTRGLGTIWGASSGLVFLIFCNIIRNNVNNILVQKLITYLIISIGIIFVIYCCNLFKKNPAINISCIAFLAVTTANAYKAPVYYAINRSIETLAGILIALMVNKFFVNPNKTKKKV